MFGISNVARRMRMLNRFNYNQALPYKGTLEDDCVADRLEARK